jgi:hypothetical protein
MSMMKLFLAGNASAVGFFPGSGAKDSSNPEFPQKFNQCHPKIHGW